MALSTYNRQETSGGTPGTLSSTGLYVNPNIPGGTRNGIGSRDQRAYQGEVQNQELVENRLGNLLDSDNRYIQNARQRGLQGASKRGLLNSSIAQGSAERAAIEAGLPIASADAQTFLQTRMQNQQDLNQNLMQERDIANRMLEAERNSLSSAEAWQAGQRDAEEERRLRLQLQRENLAFAGEQQGLDRQQQEMMSRLGYGQDLGRMESDYRFRNELATNDAFRQDWLADNQFNRNFYGDMARMAQEAQFNNSANLYATLLNGLRENPEVFGNPDYLSGINNFFRDNIFDNYFDRLLGGLGG